MLFWSVLLIALGFYSGFRLLFLIYNWNLFQNTMAVDILVAFVHGLRFDLWAVSILTSIAYLIALPIKKKNAFQWLACIFHIPFLILNVGDTEFINFAGRRLTIGAFQVVKEMQGKTGVFFISYPILSLICFLLIVLFCFCIFKIPLVLPKKFTAKKSSGTIQKKWKAFVSVVFIFLAARGGWQTKPLNFSHSQVFAMAPLNNLITNSTFSILQTVTRKTLDKESFYSLSEMSKNLNANFPGDTLLKQRPKVPQNIVIIILESFSLEHMGLPHGDKGYTPFLDELAKKSLFFKNNFANGRRSIEGIASVLGGVPALMEEPFASSPFVQNEYVGLGTSLLQKGYHTSFFHGGANGTMYFDHFTAASGIQNYFGLNEYDSKKDYDGTWGVYDEPFLQWMLSRLNSFDQPFFSTVFTLSSHHPFQVPAQYRGKFPKGESEIHESIGYADYALRKFFEAAEEQSWFQNTLFIVTADHTFKNWRPQYSNEIGRFKVPLIFYHPQIQWPKIDTDQVTSHIDIIPSVLDFLGTHPQKEFKLARSVFREGDRNVVLMLDHKYWLIKKQNFLTLDKNRGSFLFESGDWNESKPVTQPTLKAKLEIELKSAIQYYSEGMWDNRLYYPTTH